MPRPLSPKDYSAFLNRISIVSLNPVKFDASIDRAKLSPENKPTVSINDKYSIDSKPDSTVARAELSLIVTPENSKSVILSINISFEILFKHPSNTPKGFWDIYKSATLPLKIWPYFREFVQNTTARMNIPPLILPILVR